MTPERPDGRDVRRERPRDLTDVVLVASAQRGERVALDELLRRHHERIYAVCRRITTHDADAADATQQALIAIAKGIARFDGTSSFGTWTYRVATNAALDELRRRKRRPQPWGDSGPREGDSSRSALVEHAGGVALPEAGPDRDATADSTALRVDVERAMRSLPHDFRAAVVLRDLCGLDYAEIGDILGIPPGTVRSRIARGRAALAPLLRPADAPHDIPADAGNHHPTAERQRNHDG
jgi:RNA polymerase sigma-70 factor (ECF subfamily)